MGSPSPGRAADPSLVWYTLTTEHFHVHYHDDGGLFARRAAAFCEEAYTALTRGLGWRARQGRIHVVCSDTADGANGFARVQPYDVITLLPFAPEADTDLGRYDDWLRVLVIHELSHILHLDHTGVVQDVTNTLFGKIWLPNQAMPGWFIEGFATWVESTFTPLGRVGSAAFSMYLRSAVLGGTLPETIGGFGGHRLEPPGAAWNYTFGSDFITWLGRRFGREKVLAFASAYGRRLIPYGMNNLAKKTFGADFDRLFREYRADLVTEVELQVAAERKRGLRIGSRLTTGGRTHHAPRFAPTGRRIVYKGGDGTGQTRMRIAELDADRIVHRDPLYHCEGGCGRAVWAPDGSALYAIGGRWADPHRFYRSVLRYDLARRPRFPSRVSQKGVRAREIDIRGDGMKIALVTARWGRTALEEIDLSTGARRTLIPFGDGLQLNQPRYLPDGRIVVSGQPDGSWRDLFLLGKDGTLRELTRTREREIGATVGPRGRFVFYSSDLGGIWNIHALDLVTGDRWQVTRVLGGAFNPSVSADGRSLVYNGYNAGGYDLYLLGLDRAHWDRLPPALSKARPPPRLDPRDVPALVRPYRAWRSAWPRTWAPSVQFDQGGLRQLGLTLAGSDAIGRHVWSLAADYSDAREDANVAMTYSYRGARPSLNLLFSRFGGRGSRFVADEVTEFHQENLFASLGVGLAVPHFAYSFAVSADLTWWYTFDPDPPVRLFHDPGSWQPWVPEDEHRVGLRLSWSFEDVDRYALSISNERGVRMGMSFELKPRLFGNRRDRWTLTWHLDGFVPMPWAVAHVLALRYKGGLGGGEEGARHRFSVGGLPEQDLVTDLLNETGIFGTFLRGYPPGALRGETYHLLSAQYRFPIANIFWSPGTLPFWLQRLTGAVYSDTALVYDTEPTTDSIKTSLGAEVALTTTLFYNVSFNFRLGYAHALTDLDLNHFYLLLGSQF